MKSSGWYNSLWRKKLNELPVKEEADSAWVNMNKLLDAHMPANNSASNTIKSFGAKLISLLGYIVPAAAMIGTVTYVSVCTTATKNVKNKKEKLAHYHLKTDSIRRITQIVDSLSIKGSSAILLSDLANTNSINGKLTLATINKPSAVPVTVKSVDFAGQEKSGRPISTLQDLKLNIESNRRNGVDVIKPIRRVSVNNTKRVYNSGLLHSLSSRFYTTRQIDYAKTIINKNADQKTFPAPSPAQESGLKEGIAGQNEISKFERDPIMDMVQDKKLAKESAKSKFGNIQAQSDANIKASKLSGLKSAKSKMMRNKPKQQTDLPIINFGLEAGLNSNGGGLYTGAVGSYTLNKKWLVNAGVRLDLARPISGEHTHRSFNPMDSSAFKVYNSGKVQTLSIPIHIEYRLSNIISIHAGPQFSYTLKQTHVLSRLGTIVNYRDTLAKSLSIDSAFKHSSINKLTIGASAGISVRIGKLYVDGRYLQNITPYKVNTGLGSYQQYYRSFQIGIRYQLKR